MKFNTITVLNYPYMGFQYTVEIDRNNNSITYGFLDKTKEISKPKESINKFFDIITELIKEWEDTYSISKNNFADGNSFHVKCFENNQLVKEYRGTNNCPYNFKLFCSMIEDLTSEDFGSKYFIK